MPASQTAEQQASTRPTCHGELFFMYDQTAMHGEEGQLDEAVLYYYPENEFKGDMLDSIETQHRIMQMMGVSQALVDLSGEMPTLVTFRKEQIALRHWGRYTLALSAPLKESSYRLQRLLDKLFDVFTFFHGSLERVHLQAQKDLDTFRYLVSTIWSCYLPFVRRFGSSTASLFHPLPYVPLPKREGHLFLQASHILQSGQRLPSVLGGAILFQSRILCTQLEPILTHHCLSLMFSPERSEDDSPVDHPGIPLPTAIGDRIPSSVRLLNVFVTAEQYDLLCQASLGVLGAAACMSRASSSTPSASSRSTCHSGVSTGGGGGESSDVFVSQSSSISSIPLTASGRSSGLESRSLTPPSPLSSRSSSPWTSGQLSRSASSAAGNGSRPRLVSNWMSEGRGPTSSEQSPNSPRHYIPEDVSPTMGYLRRHPGHGTMGRGLENALREALIDSPVAVDLSSSHSSMPSVPQYPPVDFTSLGWRPASVPATSDKSDNVTSTNSRDESEMSPSPNNMTAVGSASAHVSTSHTPIGSPESASSALRSSVQPGDGDPPAAQPVANGSSRALDGDVAASVPKDVTRTPSGGIVHNLPGRRGGGDDATPMNSQPSSTTDALPVAALDDAAVVDGGAGSSCTAEDMEVGVLTSSGRLLESYHKTESLESVEEDAAYPGTTQHSCSSTRRSSDSQQQQQQEEEESVFRPGRVQSSSSNPELQLATGAGQRVRRGKRPPPLSQTPRTLTADLGRMSPGGTYQHMRPISPHLGFRPSAIAGKETQEVPQGLTSPLTGLSHTNSRCTTPLSGSVGATGGGKGTPVTCSSVPGLDPSVVAEPVVLSLAGGAIDEVEGLKRLNLYVQSHSATTMVLVAESSLQDDDVTIMSLFKHSLSQLGDLEVNLKHALDDDFAISSADFSSLTWDSFNDTLTSVNLPTSTERDSRAELAECLHRSADAMHDMFAMSSTISDVTLKSNQGSVYGRRTFGRETYFQQRPRPGAMSWQGIEPTTKAFALEQTAHDDLQRRATLLL